jgi:hypothetical protein
MRRPAPNQNQDSSDSTVSISVSLTLIELASIAGATWVVTSVGGPREINGADRAIRLFREAARANPRLPDRLKGQP